MKQNKICIIGQGPTVDSYKFCENLRDANVICSTWKGEEAKYQNFGSTVAGIRHEVLFNTMPIERGYGNISLQTYSTLQGIKHAITRGYDFVFKCRHDIYILNWAKLLGALELNNFNFLAWSSHKEGYLIDYMFGGPTLLMQDFLERADKKAATSAPTATEMIYTAAFDALAKDNGINKISYFFKDSVKYAIFSGGRHARPNYTSKNWKRIKHYQNKNNEEGTWDRKA